MSERTLFLAGRVVSLKHAPVVVERTPCQKHLWLVCGQFFGHAEPPCDCKVTP